MRNFAFATLAVLTFHISSNANASDELPLPIACDGDRNFVLTLDAVKWFEEFPIVTRKEIAGAVSDRELICGYTYRWDTGNPSGGGLVMLLDTKNFAKSMYGGRWPSNDVIKRVRANPAQYPDALKDFTDMSGEPKEYWECVLSGGKGCKRLLN